MGLRSVMSELYICNICGEPYVGENPPDDCPFCDAPKNFITAMDEFETLWSGELTEQEKEDIRETLELEVNATAYYRDVSEANEKYSKFNRLFKQLARVEEEHAEVACKMLGVEMPKIEGEESKGSIKEDLERTRELEEHATEKYRKFFERSENSKVKNFFLALIHAEEGHEELAGRELD